MKRLLIAMLLAGWSSVVLAQDHGQSARDNVATHDAGTAHETGYPVLSQDSQWAGVVVIIILLGMFLPAAVIGPIARALVADEEPAAPSHDEHAAHGHGH